MAHPIKSPRKLIEVALPLDAINEAAAREKAIRHGHPSTLHLWWARRPLAAARAVIFAQLVNDPGFQQGGGFKYGKNKKDAAQERKRLFKIIEDLVKWENTTNEEVLERARAEIRRSWREVCELNKDHPAAAELFDPDKLPTFHDPFAGGGAIPLEAQRLGLEAHASDLNPVAVLINKAMIEIPPKFAGRAPVGPIPASERSGSLNMTREWPGASGLAEDVRRYGAWMREEAQKRIGHLYPPVEITAEMARERPDLKPLVGRKLTVIAWLWARTVPSPDPAFRDVHVPLIASYWLCKKPGKLAWVEPVVDQPKREWRFEVRTGDPDNRETIDAGTKVGRGTFRCLLSAAPMSPTYLHEQGQRGRIGARLIAIVAEGDRGRRYLSPTEGQEEAAKAATPSWEPASALGTNTRHLTPVAYGYTTHASLFTPRQLTVLDTLAGLVAEARPHALRQALAAGIPEGATLEEGGCDAAAYADAVTIMLGIAVSRRHDRWTAFSIWHTIGEKLESLIRLSAVPMTWEFAEGNPFSQSTGNFLDGVELTANAIEPLGFGIPGLAVQRDARALETEGAIVVCTDPPYFDNIPYADLSDLFYVWLRRSLRPVLPGLMSTMLVPKADELVADPARHGGREAAERFFFGRMREVFARIRHLALADIPVAIFYAFKQSESEAGGVVSTGWDTFLSALIEEGFAIVGTWPVRTEQAGGLRNVGRNSLASSVVLVCRPRPADASTISRRAFQRELNQVLPEALDEMTKGIGDDQSPVAPVDLSQAIIGPGMAVFSKYAAVLEADGSTMSVRTALQLINRFLAEDDFDHDTQFCLHWFEQHGWTEGAFGDADTLSRGKGTSVDGMKEAGVLYSGGGKVRLRKWSEYPAEWDPRADARTPIWEALHQLIRALKQGGESASGALLSLLGGKAEAVRQLAYRLYTLCERLGQAEDARAYNELITSWTGIESAAGDKVGQSQLDLFGGTP